MSISPVIGGRLSVIRSGGRSAPASRAAVSADT
jgi:hypothetical protein